MSKPIENPPSPRVLINSLRSIGYSFETALADIIDNSISAFAKNIYISVPINDDDLYISILDDGNGMTRDDLFEAMKYGCDREYESHDLGRFGLGLNLLHYHNVAFLRLFQNVQELFLDFSGISILLLMT